MCDSRKRKHIDCLRGYAICLVIACHSCAVIGDLPWRFRQLAASGWHGVQLFFIASTITLLMSAKRSMMQTGGINWIEFFVRRFFRIAPAYYFAAFAYCFMEPSRWKSWVGIFVFATFTNSWFPKDYGQQLVLGGWSISVEFSFYVFFPIMFLLFHTIYRSFVFLVLSIIIAIFLNEFASRFSLLEDSAMENFNYFSFWNQLPVFAVANLFFLTSYLPALKQTPRDQECFSRRKLTALCLIAFGLIAAAYLPMPRIFGLAFPWIPNFFFCSILFALLATFVSDDRPRFLVNSVVQKIGQVSFSAYLWHWLVIELFASNSFLQWFTNRSGVTAILAYIAVVPIIVALTFGIAWLSYYCLEIPGMTLGRRLVQTAGSAPRT